MQAYIFLCDMSTEQECLDRALFGTNGGENQRLYYSKIALGDQLFLYNFETGVMRGPFTALTVCTHNLDPTAWKKTRRSFPWQVRVNVADAFKKPIRANDFASFISLASTKVGLLPPAQLTDEQTAKLLAVMTSKQ